MEIATANQGGNYKKAPEGMHRAICYRFVDLGTQESEYQGTINHRRKVALSFELVDEIDTFEGPDGEVSKPFAVHARHTWSMSEKGNLRPFLESWRGKAFSEDDLAEGGFDAKNLIGVPCYVNVVHAESNGKTYANIKAITPLPKQARENMPSMHNDPIYFSLQKDRVDWDLFDKFHENTQATIKRSPEYQELVGETSETSGSTKSDDADMDDEIPF